MARRDRTKEMLANRTAVTPDTPPPVHQERLDERGCTDTLSPGVYEYIRETCHARRCSQQKLFRDALEEYFKSIGGKGWDELESAVKRRTPKA